MDEFATALSSVILEGAPSYAGDVAGLTVCDKQCRARARMGRACGACLDVCVTVRHVRQGPPDNNQHFVSLWVLGRETPRRRQPAGGVADRVLL